MAIWVLALLSAICYFSYSSIRIHLYIANGNALIKATKPYAQNGNGNFKILILGDSLAYGVGASSAERSFAGRIGARYRDANIENKAKVGETIQGLVVSLHNVLTKHYNIIFVIVGANDASHYGVDIEKSKSNIAKLYKIVAANADHAYMYTSADFARISAVPLFFRQFHSDRSRVLHDESLKLAAHYKNVTYVDTFSVDKDLYESLEAKDGFHLNDRGINELIRLTFDD